MDKQNNGSHHFAEKRARNRVETIRRGADIQISFFERNRKTLFETNLNKMEHQDDKSKASQHLPNVVWQTNLDYVTNRNRVYQWVVESSSENWKNSFWWWHRNKRGSPSWCKWYRISVAINRKKQATAVTVKIADTTTWNVISSSQPISFQYCSPSSFFYGFVMLCPHRWPEQAIP